MCEEEANFGARPKNKITRLIISVCKEGKILEMVLEGGTSEEQEKIKCGRTEPHFQ